MELVVLDTNLVQIGVLDVFESLIWNDRYCGFGDFEITATASAKIVNRLCEDYYLYLKESEHVMIIEHLEIKSDNKKGSTIFSKGRSLESILERRLIWAETTLTGNFQDGILQLLTENSLDPSDVNRHIPELEFEASSDEAITSLTIDAKFPTGEVYLYKAITDLCLSKGVGYKITLTDAGKFLFKLYAGIDRSYDQEVNPYVVFSPKFDNVINANYLETKVNLKTVTLVAGARGVGNERRMVTVFQKDGEAITGLSRRELFTDAADVSMNTSGEPLTDEEFEAKLVQKGKEQLSKSIFVQMFEGQIDGTRLYSYGEDFFMGDIVQVANEYGQEAKSRVSELIHSQDAAGLKMYPTFSTV